jgi:hypothetical protein
MSFDASPASRPRRHDYDHDQGARRHRDGKPVKTAHSTGVALIGHKLTLGKWTFSSYQAFAHRSISLPREAA